MANTNCNPHQISTGDISAFTRNHYFYGKLLTVSDFQLEQDYFINKLRLHNQLLEGVGIIDGLEIIDLTSDAENITFTLTAGHAIDGDGNIILVTQNKEITKAYTKDTENYICIEYEECEQDRVPIASDDSQCADEECCYNRVRETYKVTIQDSASACVYGITCTSESEVDTKSIVLAVVEDNGIVDSTKSKDYRCTIKSNQMLQGILCNHLDTITNPNPHEIKHNDLPDMNGVDSSSSDAKNKHVSNDDAIKWNSAIYEINNISPEVEGNFSIKPGSNITIESITKGIKISSTAVAGHYSQEEFELSAGESRNIKHKFGKYPNVDIYMVTSINLFTQKDIENIAEIESKSEDAIKTKIEAVTLKLFAKNHSIRPSNGMTLGAFINSINSDQSSLLMPSNNTNNLSNEIAGNTLDEIWVAKKPIKSIKKVVGHWLAIRIEVEHKDKNNVVITNLDPKEEKREIKAILTA